MVKARMGNAYHRLKCCTPSRNAGHQHSLGDPYRKRLEVGKSSRPLPLPPELLRAGIAEWLHLQSSTFMWEQQDFHKALPNLQCISVMDTNQGWFVTPDYGLMKSGHAGSGAGKQRVSPAPLTHPFPVHTFLTPIMCTHPHCTSDELNALREFTHAQAIKPERAVTVL